MKALNFTIQSYLFLTLEILLGFLRREIIEFCKLLVRLLHGKDFRFSRKRGNGKPENAALLNFKI